MSLATKCQNFLDWVGGPFTAAVAGFADSAESGDFDSTRFSADADQLMQQFTKQSGELRAALQQAKHAGASDQATQDFVERLEKLITRRQAENKRVQAILLGEVTVLANTFAGHLVGVGNDDADQLQSVRMVQKYVDSLPANGYEAEKAAWRSFKEAITPQDMGF